MHGFATDTLSAADVMDRPTLTIPQAGQVLGVSPQSAYNAVRRGEIPTIRLGRRLLVPTHKLLQMLGHDTPNTHQQAV